MSAEPYEIEKLLRTQVLMRVLLVDDQLFVGDVVRNALCGLIDAEFHHCPDPSSAVAVAKNIQPTVILQDLLLPNNIDGLTMLQWYRRDPALARVPVVMLSSKADPRIKSSAFAAGANDYLVKPVDPVELVARLRHHSEAYRAMVERDAAQQKLVAMNAELERITRVDGLTGISNRRSLDEHLEIEWKRALRDQTPLSVLLIDVDCFKSYNDTYGHCGGDQVLVAVANTLQQNAARPGDLAGRFGGEEFMVVLPNTDLAGALHVGSRIRQGVEAMAISHDASSCAAKRVTVSVGVASVIPQQQATSITDLVNAADSELYRAKNSGRNRVCG